MTKPYNHGAKDVWNALNIVKEDLEKMYTFIFTDARKTDNISKSIELIENYFIPDNGEINIDRLRAGLFIFFDAFEHLFSLKASIKNIVGCGMEEIMFDKHVPSEPEEEEKEEEEPLNN
jgi:hypothetical protein